MVIGSAVATLGQPIVALRAGGAQPFGRSDSRGADRRIREMEQPLRVSGRRMPLVEWSAAQRQPLDS